MSSTEREEQIGSYLNELRRKVLLRAPLQDRLLVLRQLVRLSGEWKTDLDEHEKERSCDIEKELKSLLSSENNEEKIDEIVTELKNFATISPSVEKLRQAGISYLKDSRQEKEKREQAELDKRREREQAEREARLRQEQAEIDMRREREQAEREARLRNEKAELDEIRKSVDVTGKTSDEVEAAYKRAIEKLDGTRWEHPERRDLLQEITSNLNSLHRVAEEMVAREATRREFQAILDEMEEYKPDENFFVRPSRFFEEACRNWEDKSETDTPPADLAAKAAVLLKKLEEIRTKNRWLFIKIGSAIGSIAVLSLVIFVSIYLMYTVPHERKSADLASKFVQTVTDIQTSNAVEVQISQAEKLYALLEKDYPKKTKSPEVVTAKVSLDKYIIKIKELTDQCNQSINEAENAPNGVDATLLNQNALSQLKQLTPQKNETTVLDLENRFESIRQRYEERLAEIERRKQLEKLCQLIEVSIKKATKNEDDYKLEFLDNNALIQATGIATESEKTEVIQPFERTFAEIRRIADEQIEERRALAAAVKQQQEEEEARIRENARQKEFQSLCKRIEESIKEATKNPDKYDSKNLDEISWKKASELANEDETYTVDRFYQQFISVRNIAAKQQQSEIEREFDGIYKKAIASYEDASKNGDNLDESLLDNNALEIALEFIGIISAQKTLDVKTLQTNFETLKRDAQKIRSERLNVYIAAKTQDWLNVISNDNKAPYTIKVTQLEPLVADLKRQNKQTADDEDKGCPTNREVTDKAVFLFSGVSKSLEEFRYLADMEIALLKVTESVGDRRDFTDSLKNFQKKHPEVRGSESIAEFLKQGDEYWQPIQTWNQFVESYAQEVGSAPITPEKVKEIADFLANHEKTLQYIPEFSSLKYRYQVPKTGVAVFPADTIKQKIAPFAQKKLWYAIATKTGQYCYFLTKPVSESNTCYIDPPMARGVTANLKKETLDEIALAPQIDLVSIIRERLAHISFDLRHNDPKKYYTLCLDVIRTILDNEGTDPFIKCVILDDIVSAFMQSDLFFLDHVKTWKDELAKSGLVRGTNWTDPREESPLIRQRKIAVTLLNKFPLEELVEKTSDISADIAVEYTWIAWADIDTYGRTVIRQNTDRTKLITDADSSLLELRPHNLYMLLPNPQTMENRSEVRIPYTFQKIGTWYHGEIKIDNNAQIRAGFPVFLQASLPEFVGEFLLW